jgi:hypothetical protein
MPKIRRQELPPALFNHLLDDLASTRALCINASPVTDSPWRARTLRALFVQFVPQTNHSLISLDHKPVTMHADFDVGHWPFPVAAGVSPAISLDETYRLISPH